MRYDREVYERKIKESILFSIDSKGQNSLYRREAYKMTGYLYGFILSLNKEKYEPYGCEIMELAVRCIRNFDPSKGDFLHYFLRAWKMEYGHICADQIIEDKFHGIKISDSDKRKIRQYIKYTALISEEISAEELYSYIADVMLISREEAAQLAFTSEVTIISEADYMSEQKTAEYDNKTVAESPIEHSIFDKETVAECMDVIDNLFQEIHANQKRLISDLLTIRICDVACELDINIEAFSFIQKDIYQNYIEHGDLPSQKDIAEKYGRSEQSISRTLKIFLENLKKWLSE